jgi:hypothetical protein
VKEVEQIILEQRWNLETKYNKHYCGFKAGFFNAFGIKWIGTKTFALFLKLSESEAAALSPKMTRYENQWKEAVYYIDPTSTSTDEFKPLLERAYKKVTGG